MAVLSKVVLGALSLGATASAWVYPNCEPDNCYREMTDARFAAEAIEFCPGFLATTDVPISPDFENCAKNRNAVSSACSCITYTAGMTKAPEPTHPAAPVGSAPVEPTPLVQSHEVSAEKISTHFSMIIATNSLSEVASVVTPHPIAQPPVQVPNKESNKEKPTPTHETPQNAVQTTVLILPTGSPFPFPSPVNGHFPADFSFDISRCHETVVPLTTELMFTSSIRTLTTCGGPENIACPNGTPSPRPESPIKITETLPIGSTVRPVLPDSVTGVIVVTPASGPPQIIPIVSGTPMVPVPAASTLAVSQSEADAAVTPVATDPIGTISVQPPKGTQKASPVQAGAVKMFAGAFAGIIGVMAAVVVML